DTKEIEKTIQELKNTIDKSNSKKTLIRTYLEYEKRVKEIRARLKDKKELEGSLKELEDSLKKKKEERKKELEEVKKKFEEFKKQVNGATGQTYGNQVQSQGKVGGQAWQYASGLGFKVGYSISDGVNSDDFAKKVIEDTLKKIEEELKNNGEEAVEEKKE
uniref:ErpL protein n=1 Tax=Borreliella garinii TaxID=29519 RepID=UPI001AF01885